MSNKNALKYLEQVHDEIDRAASLYSPMLSNHEAYGIIKEEVDEMWDAIKSNSTKNARKEAVQVAAMAVRYLIDSEKW